MNIGILEINKDYKDVQDVVVDARIAANEASMHTSNKYKIFNKYMKLELILNENIKSKISKAIKSNCNEGFYLEYQPQVDLNTNEIIGVETLARWYDEEIGQIPPIKFIGIAEKHQMIIPFGEWVLEEACKFANTLYKQGIKNIKIAINISVIQLLEESFIDRTMNIISKTGTRAENLEFEITETGLIENYNLINNKLGVLREEGISISIDDYGVGYSSLSRLKNLHVDVLKIDKSFIDNITNVEQEDVFIQNIISLCKDLNLKIIAEGVETQIQRDYLISKQCDIMQGYLFSKPVTKNKVIDMIKKTNKGVV